MTWTHSTHPNICTMPSPACMVFQAAFCWFVVFYGNCKYILSHSTRVFLFHQDAFAMTCISLFHQLKILSLLRNHLYNPDAPGRLNPFFVMNCLFVPFPSGRIYIPASLWPLFYSVPPDFLFTCSIITPIFRHRRVLIYSSSVTVLSLLIPLH